MVKRGNGLYVLPAGVCALFLDGVWHGASLWSEVCLCTLHHPHGPWISPVPRRSDVNPVYPVHSLRTLQAYSPRIRFVSRGQHHTWHSFSASKNMVDVSFAVRWPVVPVVAIYRPSPIEPVTEPLRHLLLDSAIRWSTGDVAF